MKENEIRLLAELLKNSKKSDRELARVLRVSQATVSRTRSKLERDRVIQEYTIIPDLTKLGFELMAITTAKFKVSRNEKFMERATAYMKNYPNILLSSRSQGMGKDAIIISLHKDFTDYESFMVTLKSDWIDSAEDEESILVSLKGFTAKPFSLRYLAEILNPSKP
jgi:DNA-binding Lrp family transcriptional regulator